MKTILIACLIFLQFDITAQSNPFDIGVESGITLSSLRGNSLVDANHTSKTGGAFGLCFQYNFPKLLSIKTGLGFEQKGSHFSVPAVDINGNVKGDYKGTTTFNYLTIPLMAQFSLGKKWQPFINIGGFCSVMLNEQERIQAFSDYPGSKSNNTDLFKRTEFGITGGLGLAYNMEMPLAVSLEIRNNLGLTNISDIPVIGNGKILTNSLNFLVGISYQIGRE